MNKLLEYLYQYFNLFNMEETIVSLETAKLLKEREFSVNTNAYYDDCNKLQVDKPKNDWNDPLYLGTICSAPTQSLAQQWIREKGIHIGIYANASGWGWILTKCGGNGSCIKEIEDDTFFDTYEDALEEGLKQALKLI